VASAHVVRRRLQWMGVKLAVSDGGDGGIRTVLRRKSRCFGVKFAVMAERVGFEPNYSGNQRAQT